ncbi:hypothetical protein GPECTOR_36g22 [Gonium pectorale]|uniref:Uncharacterized protein n=1 Tax=Gonium pectorale TaxID=33097 RepID=A0A150GBR9_GONPE|nr:hypothetical protein GPECTOR_36g22 [Gonium pectorale]|eukprot:KXZ47296.1 hypothetical protein GPECTOR_36g22 [Gonium pectorale]
MMRAAECGGVAGAAQRFSRHGPPAALRLLVVAATAVLALILFRTHHDAHDGQQAAPLWVRLGHDEGSTAPVSPGLGARTALREVQPVNASVWWFAPFLDFSSFGVEATGMVQALLRHGVIPAAQLHIGLLQNSCDDQQAGSMAPAVHAQLLALRSKPSRPAIAVCHNLPPYLGRPSPRWRSCEACPPAGASSGLVRYAVARAMAETDRIPPDFVASLNSMDEVWAPTEASAAVLRGSGVTRPLRVVPLPVDTQELDPRTVEPLQLPPAYAVQVFGPRSRRGDVFTFVSVFKWELRKGYDVLLRAFLQEFGHPQPLGDGGTAAAVAPDGGGGGMPILGSSGPGGAAGPLSPNSNWVGPEVELLILTKPFLTEGPEASLEERMLQWARDALGPGFDPRVAPRVLLLGSHVGRAEYVGLLTAADAFVLPSRGEGWGLPIAEAMALGLPVIATNWSGPTAYLDDSVGYPLPYNSLVPVPHTEPYWFQGSRWAEPSLPDLRRLMRHVAGGGRAEAAARGRAARRRMLERYSPPAVAQLLAAELRRITEQTSGGGGNGAG